MLMQVGSRFLVKDGTHDEAGQILPQKLPQQVGAVAGAAATGIVGSLIDNHIAALVPGQCLCHRFFRRQRLGQKFPPQFPHEGGQFVGLLIGAAAIGNNQHTAVGNGTVGGGEAMNEGAIDEVMLLAVGRKMLLNFLSRAKVGAGHRRAHQHRQPPQGHNGLNLPTQCGDQHFGGQIAGIVHIDVGDFLGGEQTVGQLHHTLGHIGMEVHRAHNGHIGTHDLADAGQR